MPPRIQVCSSLIFPLSLEAETSARKRQMGEKGLEWGIPENPTRVTGLLLKWGRGDEAALERLIPLVHRELHRIARRCMAGERAGHSLQATALVNEAYLRLVDAKDVAWQDRAHFLAVAARVMRRILVDHARARRAQKRGGDAAQVTFDEALVVTNEPRAGLRGARRRAGGAGDIRRAEEPRRRAAVLRRVERGGNRVGR